MIKYEVEFIQAEYSLSDTPAVSLYKAEDASLYTVTLNTIVEHNTELEKLPDYVVPTSKDDE